MYNLPSDIKKFDYIVNGIQKEHTEFEEVTLQVEEIKKKLFLLKVSDSIANKSFKIAHVEVTVFPDFISTTEIFGEVAGEIITNNSQDCLYFSLQIVIPKCLQIKLNQLQFKINASVSCKSLSVNKSILLPEVSPIVIVVPFERPLLNCQINVVIFGWINGKSTVIKLPTVFTNISHFLTISSSEKNDLIIKTEHKLMKLGALYRGPSHLFGYSNKGLVEYKIRECKPQQVLEVLLQNCYPYIHLSSFKFDGKTKLDVYSRWNSKIYITFKNKSSIAILESDIFNLDAIKKCLIDMVGCEKSVIKNLVQQLGTIQEDNYKTIIDYYKALRNSMV